MKSLMLVLDLSFLVLKPFLEDIWAGGGNCGPSMEYFVKGLEVGNMVFMQYKTSPDGQLEELPIKVREKVY